MKELPKLSWDEWARIRNEIDAVINELSQRKGGDYEVVDP